MAHVVCRKGRYYSLEESYREGKRVRKRTLFYFGTRRPSDPQARYEQMIATAERKAEEIDAMQREKFGETASELRERLEDEARFAPKDFLEATATAPDTSCDDPAAEPAQENSADEPDAGDASESEA